MIYNATVQLDIYGIIGLNIKKRRIELGMIQTELAMICNMPRTSLSKFEAAVNKIPIDTLELICSNLNCKISEMFDYALHNVLIVEGKERFSVTKDKTTPCQ